MKQAKQQAKQPDVHEVAAKFLASYIRGQALQVQPVADTVEDVIDVDSPKMIVVRNAKPQFFAGEKRSGQFVWTYDIRLAQQLDEATASAFVARIPNTMSQWAVS